MSPTARFALAALLVLTTPAAAVEWTSFEGSARGFPVLRDETGRKVADGNFAQWNQNGRLHVRITFANASRRVEEQAILRQRPELTQESWTWREVRDGRLYREFTVDLTTGKASAKKLEDGRMQEWSGDVSIEPGRTFAGFGFSMALKALRPALLRGEHVRLHTVGFTPKPKGVDVEVSYAGTDDMGMAGRTIRGERFIVHPKIPWIAKPFVSVPDAQIWLTSPPVSFLRSEGPLAEPDDPITRVDLLPGGSSTAAKPVGTSGRQP